MGLREHKKLGIGVSLVAVFGAIATVIGFYSDIKDIFSKDDDKTQEVVVTSIVTPEEKQEVPVVEKTQEEVIITEVVTTTEKITEPPVTEPPVVYLADIEPTDSHYFTLIPETSVKDTVGNEYITNVSVLKNSWANSVSAVGGKWAVEEGDVTYYLGGKYKTFSGTIAIDNNSDSDMYVNISIITDDNVVYTLDEVSRVLAPTDFSIDVENVQWLTLKQTNNYEKTDDIRGEYYKGCIYTILSNLRLE